MKMNTANCEIYSVVGLQAGSAALALCLMTALALVVTPRGVAYAAPPACRNAVIVDRLPAYPIAITNNAVTSVVDADGRTTIYSFMGITNPVNRQEVTALSYKITVPGDDSWSAIADAPTLNGLAKIGATATAVNGRIFLIGGYTVEQRQEITEKRLFEYDPATDRYIERTVVPTEVDDTVAGVYQDRYIYIISGWHGPVNNNVATVQIYDTANDEWGEATPIIDPLPGLFGHAGTIAGNRIIYCDGVTTTGGFKISNRVFTGVIDPRQTGRIDVIRWEELPAHPGLPTYRAAASQGGGAIGDDEGENTGLMYLVGGTDNPYNFNGVGYNGKPSDPADQLLALNVRTGEWIAPDLVLGDHLPTMDHRGLVRVGDGFGGEAWVTVGGMTEPRIATDVVERYRIVRDEPAMLGPKPGVAGEINTIEIHCGVPGSRVSVLYSDQTGEKEIPNCPGVVLHLENPKVVGRGVYDENGVAMVEGVVPALFRGALVYLQAVEVGRCRVSNPVAVRFE